LPGARATVVTPDPSAARTSGWRLVNASTARASGVTASVVSSTSKALPRYEWASTNPGTTQELRASVRTFAPAGTSIAAPTFWIFPSAMSTIPDSISAPSTGTMRAPLRTRISAFGASD
jgi:hypothetical protein